MNVFSHCCLTFSANDCVFSLTEWNTKGVMAWLMPWSNGPARNRKWAQAVKRTSKFPHKYTRVAKKNHFKADISCISLAYNRLIDVTQLALGGQTVKNLPCLALRANLASTKVSASHRKSTQVRASPGQTESQVDPSFQLVSTCESVWPGHKALF